MDKTLAQAALPHPRGHLSYYGLRDTPFGAGGGPRPLWLGRTHREVLATLTAAIRHGDGSIILLTGDVGTGKTGVANQLIGMLSGDSLVIGRIPGPIFDVSELSPAVADAFGIQGELPSGTSFAAHFGELLGRAGSPGKKVLLILDEAQNLSDDLLHKVLELSSIGTLQGYPLAILLVGESELGDELAKDHYAGLRHRIATRCVLEPLSEEEVGEYIRSCLEIAGSEEMIFDRDAVREIAAISRGAPGVINVVCERALVAGYRRQAPVIGRGIIDDCLGKWGSTSHSPARHDRRPAGARRDGVDGGGADDGGARDREIARRGAHVTELPRHASRASRAALWFPLLTAVMLGVAGDTLYAGWFDQIRERPGPESAGGTSLAGAPRNVAVRRRLGSRLLTRSVRSRLRTATVDSEAGRWRSQRARQPARTQGRSKGRLAKADGCPQSSTRRRRMTPGRLLTGF